MPYSLLFSVLLFSPLTPIASDYKGPPLDLTMKDDEGIVVIGSKAGPELKFYNGTVHDNGTWWRDKNDLPAFAGRSRDGYFVAKLKASAPGTEYAFLAFRINWFQLAECSANLMTFPVQAGKIQYVADIFVSNDDGKATIGVESKMDGAVKYLKQTYQQEVEIVQTMPYKRSHQHVNRSDCVRDGELYETYPPAYRTRKPIFSYPDEALKQRVNAEVSVRVLINEFGAPESAEVIKSSNKDFNASAVDGLMNARFKPYIQKGKPSPVYVIFPIHFDSKRNTCGDVTCAR